MTIDEFILAAKRNDIALIRKYLSNGFDINTQDEFGFTALIESAEFGNIELFWELIKNSANIHIKAEDNYSIIHAIGIGGNEDMLNYVVNNGVSINEKVTGGEQKGMGLKEYAKYGKNVKILKWLEGKD